MQLGQGQYSIAFLLGLLAASSGCSGKVETTSKLASTCPVGGCEDSGVGGAPANGAGGTQGSDASAASGGVPAAGGSSNGSGGGTVILPTDAATQDVTLRVDASSPPPDPCPAVPAASCAELSTLVNPVPGWSILRTLVPRTGAGWVIEASRPYPVSAGNYFRAFYVDAADPGCATPVSTEVLTTSAQWAVDDAAVAGGTRAAVLVCAYKFPCGAELHRNGVRLADLNAGLPPQAVYGGMRHRVAVRTDGELVVVSAMKTDIPVPADLSVPLGLSWYAADGTPEGSKSSSESLVGLLATAAVDAGNLHGVAVALRAQNDGGTGPDHVDLFTTATEISAQWFAPAEVALTVDGLAANDTTLGVLGTVSATQKPWLAMLDLPSLTVRFQVSLDEIGTEVGLSLFGSNAVLGLALDTSVALREYDLTGGNPKTVARFPYTPPQGAAWPPTFGVAPTGLLVAWNADVARCDATP